MGCITMLVLHRHVMIALALVSIPACKKKNDKPVDPGSAATPTGSGSGSATPAALAGSAAPTGSATPAAGADCPPSAFKAKSGAFCVDAPGFTAKDETRNGPFGGITFNGAKDANGFEAEVNVNWQFEASETDYDDRVKTMMENAHLKDIKLEEQGDLTGVTGKWVITSNGGYKTIDSVTKGKTSNFNCESLGPREGAVPANVQALCKGIHPLL